jgi:dTDP-4-dehydrorhamnose reductase
VFDGTRKTLYTENDQPNPLSQYGKSKFEGEKAVQGILSDHLLFRVSWVFGPGGINFLAKAKQWAKERTELKISDDEISVPTYVDDIVDGTLSALAQGAKGMYHLTSTGSCSRYEWVKFFFEIMKFDNRIVPVPSAEFHLAAKRPVFSAMDNRKIANLLKIDIPGWQKGVERFAQNLKEKGSQ